MRIDVSATLCYGIAFKEGFGFPWDESPWDGDHESWWESVAGYKPTFNPYDDRGEYKEGILSGDKCVSEHYQEHSDWWEKHPFPVVINMCGSYDCFDAVLSAPKLGCGGDWETPTEFSPVSLRADTLSHEKLLAFCKRYKIDIEDKEPKWYITCLYS